jgi:hypothetical protein
MLLLMRMPLLLLRSGDHKSALVDVLAVGGLLEVRSCLFPAGRDHEEIRRQRVNAKRRTAYEKSHFAIVGRPSPTVIPFVSAKRVVAPRPPSPAGRILKNVFVSQVGRFQFRLIHR